MGVGATCFDMVTHVQIEQIGADVRTLLVLIFELGCWDDPLLDCWMIRLLDC